MLRAVIGLPGGGKSYVVTNHWIGRYLRGTRRHVYTNMPINIEPLLLYLSGNPAERDDMRGRLHLVEPGLDYPLDAEGNIRPLPDPTDKSNPPKLVERQACRLREFWEFTQPNSVMIFDEVAELWNAREFAHAPRNLGMYVNQHRHYLDDILLICHKLTDIDKQIREKVAETMIIENSLKRNIFGDKWWGMGLKYPIQFFFVRTMVREVMKGNDSWTKEEEFPIFPRKRGFRNYRSFSQSSRLPGKQSADTEKAQSDDFNQPLWKRLLSFARTAQKLFFMGFAAILAAFLTYRFILGLLMFGQDPASAVAAKAVSPEAPSNPPASPASPGATTPQKQREKADRPNLQDPVQQEYAEEITVLYVRTNLGFYRVGDRLRDGKRLNAIGADYATVDDVQTPWRLVFRGKRDTSSGSGSGDKQGMEGDRVAQSRKQRDDRQRENGGQQSGRGREIPGVSPGS